WPMSFWRRRRREADLEEEVRSHLEMAARESVERGETAKKAEQAARREFGNVELVKETARDARGWRWMEDIVEDARYGLRRMRNCFPFWVHGRSWDERFIPGKTFPARTTW